MEVFEGIVGSDGPVYSIEDIVGGGALKGTSPYEPSAIGLKDGRLLMVYAAVQGGDGVGSKGHHGIISEDEGRTFHKPFPLRTMEGASVKGGRAISLLRLQSGSLGIICGDTFYCSPNEGKTWTGGAAIGPKKWGMHVRNDSAVVLKSGRIVAPAYMYRFGPDAAGNVEEFGFGIVYYSDDEGKTWRESKNVLFVPLDRGLSGMYQWDEWSLVELKDDRLLGMGRTNLGRLFQSVSDDGGETWQAPEPTLLAADSAPCILRRIPTTGDLIVIWTQTSAKEIQAYLTRHRLSCAISRDEGKTWEKFKNLESLDDVTRIEPSEIGIYHHEPQFSTYHQPEDRKRYYKAPGPLRCAYPTCTFLGEVAIITYGYGCKYDIVGYVACKIRVLPVKWFYD